MTASMDDKILKKLLNGGHNNIQFVEMSRIFFLNLSFLKISLKDSGGGSLRPTPALYPPPLGPWGPFGGSLAPPPKFNNRE